MTLLLVVIGAACTGKVLLKAVPQRLLLSNISIAIYIRRIHSRLFSMYFEHFLLNKNLKSKCLAMSKSISS
ncbi:uncharacterized protein EV154DRAFT_527768 [Mucor mucedo]|uniref:uncharacterized protein n=1 Tax=Mucor mucedo TaxID=29922 RepID=UPI00221E3F0D|nr:uncharacterized protein EV154DRAFT_527768 [Mucor mucedo]KAI7873698.1 hypothetical protein EV154DRAFT_527768 [Mucor mucedo]